MLNAPGKTPHVANQQGNKDTQQPAFFGASQFFSPAAVVQTKLEVNEPGDEYEKEADAVADTIMTKPEAAPGIQRQDEMEVLQRKADTPAAVGNDFASQLGHGGAPMDAGVRSGMESHFGVGFDNVKVHTDSNAAQLSRGLSAQAFTHGNDIYFNEGKYNPATSSGKHLLAHELTHVVQQSGGIQRKTDPKAPGYYTTAEKIVEDEESMMFNADQVERARNYLKMTEAVMNSDAVALPALVKTFLSGAPFYFALGYPTSDEVSEIIVKLLSMGLTQEADDLRTWFPKHQRIQGEPQRDVHSLEIYFSEKIMEHLPDVSKLTSVKEAADAADIMVRLILQMNSEQKLIDIDKVKEIVEARRTGAAFDYMNPYSLPMADHTIVGYFYSLSANIVTVFQRFQVAYQVILEAAISDLEQGKGNTNLDLAKSKLDQFNNQKFFDRVLNTDVDITKSEYKKGADDKIKSGKQVDYFLDKKQARKQAVDINLYDPDSYWPPLERQANWMRIMEARYNEISLLQTLYGVAVAGDTKEQADAKKENADAVKQAGGLKLHSNDDWRKFALEKFEAHKKQSGDKAAAFMAVISLLERYLKAFTLHTPANIDDWGDNQLTVKYPRALTGQLIHDCGVYALRIVYILQLLRNHPDLKLDIKFVRLPVHTGLVITGDGLPALFVHNDTFSRYDDIAGLETAWQGASSQKSASHEQFLGEIAAELFIAAVDMPFRLVDAPQLKGTTADVNTLWNFYQKSLMPDVFSKNTRNSKDKNYNFHLKYLAVMNTFKHYYNDTALKFWNGEVVPKFKARKADMLKAEAEMNKATTPEAHKAASDKLDTLFAAYEKELEAGMKKFEDDFAAVQKASDELNKEVADNPDAIAKGTPVSDSARVQTVLQKWTARVKGEILDRNLSKARDPRNQPVDPVQ